MDVNRLCLNCFGDHGGFEVCPRCGHVLCAAPAEPYYLAPGTVLHGRVVVGTALGAGGFGITYRAWDAVLESPVAVKEFYPAGLANRMPGGARVMLFSGGDGEAYRAQLARFMDEARNLAQFSGDAHVVSVLDFFVENNTAYIVMEYLDGVTLKTHLAQRGGRLPQTEALDIALGVLQGLASIHKKGIIHRDISPDNIFLQKNGGIKILDFGAARLAAKEDAAFTQNIVVKKGYAPPEQYRSNTRQGPYTDIYAAGATLYKMLTGITPEESIERTEQDGLPRVTQTGAAVEPGVDRAVMKAMALRPELRFAKADDMMAALCQRAQVQFPEEELRQRKRRRFVFVAGLLAVVLCLGGLLWWRLAYPQGDTLATRNIKPDTISVCFPVWDETDEVIYTDIVNEFCRMYPQHTVEVIACEYYEYDEIAFTPLGTKNGPTVVQSTWMDPMVGEQAADLTILASSIDRGAHWFLDEWEVYYPRLAKLPTGLNVLTAYADISPAAFGAGAPQKITGVGQLADIAAGGNRISMADVDTGLLLQLNNPGMYGDDSFTFGANALQRDAEALQSGFAQGAFSADIYADDIPLQICWANNLHTYQEMWPGHSRAIPIEGRHGMLGILTNEWSVNAGATANQQMVGMLFINFLLSDYAQTRMYVQQDGYVPLNRSAFASYVKTNDDLDFIDGEALAAMQVQGEGVFALTEFSYYLYTDVLDPQGPTHTLADFFDYYEGEFWQQGHLPG